MFGKQGAFVTFLNVKFSDTRNLAAEIYAMGARQTRSNACSRSGTKLPAEAFRFVIFL
jgi:hypothetical protein